MQIGRHEQDNKIRLFPVYEVHQHRPLRGADWLSARRTGHRSHRPLLMKNEISDLPPIAGLPTKADSYDFLVKLSNGLAETGPDDSSQ